MYTELDHLKERTEEEACLPSRLTSGDLSVQKVLEQVGEMPRWPRVLDNPFDSDLWTVEEMREFWTEV